MSWVYCSIKSLTSSFAHSLVVQFLFNHWNICFDISHLFVLAQQNKWEFLFVSVLSLSCIKSEKQTSNESKPKDQPSFLGYEATMTVPQKGQAGGSWSNNTKLSWSAFPLQYHSTVQLLNRVLCKKVGLVWFPPAWGSSIISEQKWFIYVHTESTQKSAQRMIWETRGFRMNQLLSKCRALRGYMATIASHRSTAHICQNYQKPTMCQLFSQFLEKSISPLYHRHSTCIKILWSQKLHLNFRTVIITLCIISPDFVFPERCLTGCPAFTFQMD